MRGAERMNILLSGIFLITAAFLLHLAVWRLRCPKFQTRALLWIFFGTCFSAAAILTLFILAGHPLPAYLPQNISDLFHTILFFSSFTLAYVITYSALEADSPSLVIVRLIAAAAEAGLEEKALRDKLSDRQLVVPRIKDLIRDELALWENGRLRLTPAGERFVGIFTFYRSLMKAKKGG